MAQGDAWVVASSARCQSLVTQPKCNMVTLSSLTVKLATSYELGITSDAVHRHVDLERTGF